MEPEILVNLAKVGFEAYNNSAGGKTYDGKPIPEWEDLSDAVRSHWVANVRAIVKEMLGILSEEESA